MSQLKETHRPVVLTVNGKAELVVQDVVTYQKTLDRLEYFAAVEAMRVGIAAVEQGQVKPARHALAALESLAFEIDTTATAAISP